jgi:hypothetical protein
MRKIRILVLVVMIAAILLLSGCDVWDMIMDDIMRDILSKLNPFSHLFSGNGTTAVSPTSAQAAGVAVLTTALITILALANGTFQNFINFFSRLGQGTHPVSGSGTALPEAGSKNAEELWEIIKRGGPELDKLTRSMLDQKLANLAAGSLPETLDIVGAPPTPTYHETYDRLRGGANQITGNESQDGWINISALLDKGTTVRSIIVGLLTMAGVSLTTATAPWIIGIGLSAAAIDKYGPDAMNMLEMFMEPGQPDSGLPERTGPVFTPVPPEKYPELKKEELWNLPRDERLKMWQDSRDWIQKLVGGDPPTTVEGWERKVSMSMNN